MTAVALAPEPAGTAGDQAGTAAARWPMVAVLGSGTAATLHCVAAFDHAGDGLRHVVFFTVAAAAQLVLAAALPRARPLVVLAGVLGTVTLIGAYVVATQMVLPFAGGHHGAGREAPSALGLGTVAAELVALAAMAAMLTGRWRTAAVNLALLGGAGLWVLWLTGFGA